MLAMSAARTGNAEKAVDWLLHPLFQFDDVGMPVGGEHPIVTSNELRANMICLRRRSRAYSVLPWLWRLALRSRHDGQRLGWLKRNRAGLSEARLEHPQRGNPYSAVSCVRGHIKDMKAIDRFGLPCKEDA